MCRVLLTSFPLVEPCLEVADLRLLAEHLAAVGVHAGLELAHVPERSWFKVLILQSDITVILALAIQVNFDRLNVKLNQLL